MLQNDLNAARTLFIGHKRQAEERLDHIEREITELENAVAKLARTTIVPMPQALPIPAATPDKIYSNIASQLNKKNPPLLDILNQLADTVIQDVSTELSALNKFTELSESIFYSCIMDEPNRINSFRERCKQIDILLLKAKQSQGFTQTCDVLLQKTISVMRFCRGVLLSDATVIYNAECTEDLIVFKRVTGKNNTYFIKDRLASKIVAIGMAQTTAYHFYYKTFAEPLYDPNESLYYAMSDNHGFRFYEPLRMTSQGILTLKVPITDPNFFDKSFRVGTCWTPEFLLRYSFWKTKSEETKFCFLIESLIVQLIKQNPAAELKLSELDVSRLKSFPKTSAVESLNSLVEIFTSHRLSFRIHTPVFLVQVLALAALTVKNLESMYHLINLIGRQSTINDKDKKILLPLHTAPTKNQLLTQAFMSQIEITNPEGKTFTESILLIIKRRFQHDLIQAMSQTLI